MTEELATPKHKSPCRGGFKTRPYAWTFTIKENIRYYMWIQYLHLRPGLPLVHSAKSFSRYWP
jgi:hypothetical protein